MRKSGLGRGLSALMDEVAASHAPTDAGPAPVSVAIARIVANPGQPRRFFEPQALADLVASIRDRGVLQPILVRPAANDRYEIVAGERRWRAAQQAGLHEIPVVVRDLDDRSAFEIALIENIQRADLNAIEEAEGFSRLVSDYDHTPEQIGAAIGKSRSYVANLLRLLELPDNIRQMVVDGRLSSSHARAVIGHIDAAAIAHKAAEQGWSVRQIEAATKKGSNVEIKPDNGRVGTGGRDPNLVALEQSMADALGTAVEVVPGDVDKWSGTVVVHYSALDQLDMICQRLLAGTGRFD
ncbi:ParB/RepB/Spo0J family partition protein [Sphingosinicellaceae bacterium]|nr:ParB/RepB/Spo0J family partition protein [Sphingosinicellaceae bacterium]